MKSIDIKSLLIGILGTALVMVLMGHSSSQPHYDIECTTDSRDRLLCKRFNLNSDEPFNENPKPGIDTAIWQFKSHFFSHPALTHNL